MYMKPRFKKGIPSFLDKYKGKWVALTDDEKVVAAGRTIQDILPYIQTGSRPGAYALFIPPKKGRVQL